MRNKIITLVLGLGLTGLAKANESDTMAYTMRSNGKIYVVVAVVLTILIGLIVYMVRIDRKITRLEKIN